jgi:hypothetical protein
MSNTVELVINTNGKSYRELFATVSDADQQLRKSSKNFGISVLPDCTETGEDLGRGKLYRDLPGTQKINGTYVINDIA